MVGDTGAGCLPNVCAQVETAGVKNLTENPDTSANYVDMIMSLFIG